MALHWSFEPHPKKKGSYYRKLEDITRALAKFEVTALPPNSPAQFVAYYFGAEKLAKAIAGIFGRVAAEEAFEFVAVKRDKIKSAVEPMGSPFLTPTSMLCLCEMRTRSSPTPPVKYATVCSMTSDRRRYVTFGRTRRD